MQLRREKVIEKGLLTAVFLLLFNTSPVFAEGLTIGFPDFSRDMNLITADHPAALFVRGAITASLTRLHSSRSKSDPPFRLSLGSNLSSNPDFSTWLIGIRRGVQFSNGKRVRADDVIFSLKLCSLPDLKEFRRTKPVRADIDRADWIEVVLKKEGFSESYRKDFALRLARCPIYEKYSSELFGKDFGKVTNVVSAGKYNIIRFHNEKQILLERIFHSGRRGASEYDVVLRGFSDPQHGLTAVRMGTVDAFFTKSQDVYEKASSDETLLVSSCLGHRVIKRRGLSLNCFPELNVAGIRYSE